MRAEKKTKIALLVCLLAACCFILGAFWATAKLPPYGLLHKLKDYLVVEDESVLPNSISISDFSTLQLSSFNVGDYLTIGRTAGGIDAFQNKVLIVSHLGEFYLYENDDGSKSIKKLDIEIDNGYDFFRDYMITNSFEFANYANKFRFIDILYNRSSSPPTLLVTHHQWHKDEQCYTLRLSMLPLRSQREISNVSASTADWQTVYDTSPCLTLKGKGDPFEGHVSGGRIVMENSSTVILTVGDHRFDGWNSVHIHAQDAASDYGKIIRIDLMSGLAEHVSIGHRNPQGLTIDKDGTIWSTEHGPQGGDELNIIKPGLNYGWPYVTYGSQYGKWSWPLSKTQNRHDGYTRPVFSWGPMMGVSNVIEINGFLPEWDGDLLVSSLREKMLHRIRYRDDRVIFDESVYVGSRIRDLDQLANETIVLWTDDSSIIEMSPIKDPAPLKGHGAKLIGRAMQQRKIVTSESCQECHSVRTEIDPEDSSSR